MIRSSLVVFFIAPFLVNSVDANTELQTSVYAWTETNNSISSNGFISDIHIGFKPFPNIHGGLTYENFESESFEYSAIGLYGRYRLEEWSFSISLLSSLNNKINVKLGLRGDLNYHFKLSNSWSIGPKLTYRAFTGDMRFKAFRPMFFSNITF